MASKRLPRPSSTALSRSSDAASLLREVPGMSLYSAGGVSSLPVLRGLGDDRLRVRVDGMDLISACGNHMNPPLSYVAPSSVATAEVFAGIAPVSLGGDSIGGTIQVETRPLVFAQPGESVLQQGEIGAFYRSNGHARGADASATLASEQLSLNYQGSTAEAGNYRAGGNFKPAGPAAAGRGWLAADEVGSSAYKSVNQSLSLALRRDHHLLELRAGVQDIPYQLWPNQRMDMTGNDSRQLNLGYQGDYDWGQLELRAYNEKTRHAMQFGDDKLFWYGPVDGLPGPICQGMMCYAAGMPMDTEGNNTGLSLKTTLPLSDRDVLRLGSDFQRYRLDDWWEPSGRGMYPEVFININDGERDRLAAYVEWDAQWSSRWSSQLGLRGERVRMHAGQVQGYNPGFAGTDASNFNQAERSKTDYNLDITALVRFTPSDSSRYELGYAQKTRSPNLYERYSWSTNGMAMRMINLAGDGNGYVGNLQLQPEIAHTLSASAQWQDAQAARWQASVTPYLTYVDDYVDARRCDSGGMSCTPANLSATEGFVYLQFANTSARLYGVDLAGELRLGEVSQNNFSLRGNLSYVRGENRSSGDNLYNIMPLNARFALDHVRGAWSNTLEWELVSAKRKVSAERNEVATSGYGLVNLSTRYEWDRVELSLGIDNLFDRLYNHPLGGAYLGQGKTMSATDVAWGTPVPGMGRSVYTGIRVSF